MIFLLSSRAHARVECFIYLIYCYYINEIKSGEKIQKQGEKIQKQGEKIQKQGEKIQFDITCI